MPIDAKVRLAIEKKGYITIDEMMRQVLSVYPDSYYKSLQDIGSNGDFITAPEISQLFGETIALWSIEKWRQLGRPKKFNLLELGPGQGTLMSDLLRTVKVEPEFTEASEVCLYDLNPFFIKKQELKLERFNIKINRLNCISDLNKQPTIVIANEFFDALPIKQFIKSNNRWFERTLIIDHEDQRIKYDKIEVNGNLHDQLEIEHKNAADGAVIEESVESLKIIRDLASLIKKYSGSILAIDYGYNIEAAVRKRSQYNSTLQAVKNHSYHSIIESLGEADLTAHVDFWALRKSAAEQGVDQYRFFSQADFLLQYGIDIRCLQLQKNLKVSDAKILSRQLYRLTASEQMGRLFKVLELLSVT